MIEILPQSTGNVIGIRVNGKLVHQDYQQFIPKLEAIISEYGSVCCYFEMTNFDGISWQAMWDEMKFDMTHCNQIERCAIVGDPSWHQWMSKVGKNVFRWANIENFTPDQTEEAWNWVTQQENEYACSSCGTNANTNGTYGSATGNTSNTTGSYGNTSTNQNNTTGNYGNASSNTGNTSGSYGNTSSNQGNTSGTNNPTQGQTN
ncbi:MAG: STAS/SEC14 domain-containing protein [Pirellulales bacterium]|nr:STAS/SEC14 domain-containing protein [Pirellulales bacterium]